MTSLLDTINTPDELRQLGREDLPRLANELRKFLIESVAQTGGHLSSNLGTVELTIALHYVFNTPYDRLIWDVGHQCYTHKILTGRRHRMNTLRQYQGLAGFPKRDESPHDTFGTAHSSTSISAAQGMAVAARLRQENRRSIAIIGDGAMTAGMAFEALNNAGVQDTNILVILNDNDMSISPPVGALNKYLSRLLSSRSYNQARALGKRVLELTPFLELARRAEEHAKGMIAPGTLFEEFGFRYFGPIDGHDIEALLPTLQNLRELSGPLFLHVITKKGHGYKLAETDPVLYHGVNAFNPTQGMSPTKSHHTIPYTQVFGDWLCDMAKQDPTLIAITPAMREGSGMVRFESEFPSRYFDVGIAEQHAVTFAAGLACEGMKPVVAIYSTFLQRAYDQLIHDVALQNLPVLFAIDRAGLVGADGPTHAGAYDISYLRCIPNLTIMTPSDENECRQMLYTGFKLNQPCAVRYPRGNGIGITVDQQMTALPFGQGEIRREGNDVAILCFGTLLHTALAIAPTINATVANMRFVKPIDKQLIDQLARTHRLIVTLEDNTILGGAGSAVAEILAETGYATTLLRLGLPDRFVDQGDIPSLMKECGLDAEGILASIQARLAHNPPHHNCPTQ